MNSELLLLFYQRSHQHSNEIYFYKKIIKNASLSQRRVYFLLAS